MSFDLTGPQLHRNVGVSLHVDEILMEFEKVGNVGVDLNVSVARALQDVSSAPKLKPVFQDSL